MSASATQGGHKKAIQRNYCGKLGIHQYYPRSVRHMIAFHARMWRFSVAVTAVAHQRSYSTSDPVSTGMGDGLWTGKPPQYVTSYPGQVSLLPSAGLEMSIANVRDAVRLGIKGRHGSFHLWMHVWVAGTRRPASADRTARRQFQAVFPST